eukprot:COSAG05_NODE_8412_length_706_cov_0.937397_1_plen_52_part_01
MSVPADASATIDAAKATEQFKEQIRVAGGGARNKENAYGQKEEGGISMRQMK